MLPFKALTTSVCLVAVAPAAMAQQPLTLADATARALDKNHSIRIEREEIAAADARMLDARGAYDAQLRFELGARHHKDSITSFFSGAPAGSVAPSQNTFQSGVSLSQAFRSGAVATISTSLAREGNNSAFTMFDPACRVVRGGFAAGATRLCREVQPWLTIVRRLVLWQRTAACRSDRSLT